MISIPVCCRVSNPAHRGHQLSPDLIAQFHVSTPDHHHLKLPITLAFYNGIELAPSQSLFPVTGLSPEGPWVILFCCTAEALHSITVSIWLQLPVFGEQLCLSLWLLCRKGGLNGSVGLEEARNDEHAWTWVRSSQWGPCEIKE